jgi:hypothetical protein
MLFAIYNLLNNSGDNMTDRANQKTEMLFKLDGTMPFPVDGKEVYRFVTAQYLHQNQLSWSRLQTIFVIEAGLLAWLFSAKFSILIYVIGMILGSIAIGLLHQLILRDWKIRDQNTHLLDQVHKPLHVKLIKEADSKWLSGRCVAAYLTYGSIVINIVLLPLRYFGAV